MYWVSWARHPFQLYPCEGYRWISHRGYRPWGRRLLIARSSCDAEMVAAWRLWYVLCCIVPTRSIKPIVKTQKERRTMTNEARSLSPFLSSAFWTLAAEGTRLSICLSCRRYSALCHIPSMAGFSTATSSVERRILALMRIGCPKG